jgi:hypothetical protein
MLLLLLLLLLLYAARAVDRETVMHSMPLFTTYTTNTHAANSVYNQNRQ